MDANNMQPAHLIDNVTVLSFHVAFFLCLQFPGMQPPSYTNPFLVVVYVCINLYFHSHAHMDSGIYDCSEED